MKLSVAVLAVVMSGAALAAFEWTPPRSWELPDQPGGKFICTGREGWGGTNLPEIAEFRDFGVGFRVDPVRYKDGTYVFDLDRMEKSLPKNADGSPRPFFLTFGSRVTMRPHMFLCGRICHDPEAYRKWLAAHPTFLGYYSGEWVNDAIQPFHGAMTRFTTPSKRRAKAKTALKWKMTTNEVAEVLARDEYVHAYDSRGQFVTNLLKKCFSRIVEIHEGDAGRLMVGDGVTLADGLVADWGCGQLSIEATRNGCLWQRQMMGVRGAAREFGGLPWRWYAASYFRGFDSKGRWCSEGYLNADHPTHGISPSALKRAAYMAFLAGASRYEREDGMGAYWHKADKSLSDEGKAFVEFRRFAARVDRGVPYQPVAILMSRFRGYGRNGGKAWRCFYEHSDRHLDVVMNAVLDTPSNSRRSDLKKGCERVMANARYGDLFDILVADCERQECFRKALMDYRVAVLTGAYAPNPEMEATLKAYVEQGGTLVVNVAQLTDGIAWAKDGKVVRADEKGAPVYSEKALGKGRVILSHIPYAAPWYGDDDAAQNRMLAETTDSGDPIRFPHVEWLFDRLMPSLTPAKVTGDIQYGFNRTKDGWLVYLINNGGVTKFGDKLPEYDPKGVDVTVDLSNLPHAAVRELVANRPFATEGAVLKINVPSGDLAVLELK